MPRTIQCAFDQASPTQQSAFRWLVSGGSGRPRGSSFHSIGAGAPEIKPNLRSLGSGGEGRAPPPSWERSSIDSVVNDEKTGSRPALLRVRQDPSRDSG